MIFPPMTFSFHFPELKPLAVLIMREWGWGGEVRGMCGPNVPVVI